MVVRETEDGHVRPAVEVGLLGALRLRVDGVEVAVPGERRRALLALLTVAVNFVVDWMLYRSSGLKE